MSRIIRNDLIEVCKTLRAAPKGSQGLGGWGGGGMWREILPEGNMLPGAAARLSWMSSVMIDT
jgi:hypothetical protein